MQHLETVTGLVFFVAWLIWDIKAATAAIVLISFVALALSPFLKHKKIPKRSILLFSLVFVFGGISLLLEDPKFIQLKTSAVYTSFAVILLFMRLWMKKNPLAELMQDKFEMAENNWNLLTYMLAINFLVIALINYYILSNFSEQFWITAKTFGYPIAQFFIIIAMIFFCKYKDNRQNIHTNKTEGSNQ